LVVFPIGAQSVVAVVFLTSYGTTEEAAEKVSVSGAARTEVRSADQK
jgi:hypothetical protein